MSRSLERSVRKHAQRRAGQLRTDIEGVVKSIEETVEDSLVRPWIDLITAHDDGDIAKVQLIIGHMKAALKERLTPATTDDSLPT